MREFFKQLYLKWSRNHVSFDMFKIGSLPRATLALERRQVFVVSKPALDANGWKRW